jgi:cell division protein FtsN
MSRDMKQARKAPARRKSGGGTLVGLFFGLVIGVIGAAAVVWYINKTPTPFTAKSPAAASTPATAPDKTDGSAAAPPALPGKPGDTAPSGNDKPRFDFYKILPGASDANPDAKPGKGDADARAKTDKAEKAADKEAALKEPAFLQAGSFQNASDADNQKAKLAMIGVEATVQQVMVQDKVWYRVRLGPYNRVDELNRMRAELARQGVDAAVVKKD